MTQEEVNVLYGKAYVTPKEVEALTGISRQGIWYLTENGTFKIKRDENGRPFINTNEVIAYVLSRKKELLEQLEKLKLPTDR